jgi:hypothetical protein
MTAPIVPGGSGSRTRPKVNVGQLWSGGVATAIVASLVALVGVLVCRWLFGSARDPTGGNPLLAGGG